ncbi:GtrA family protein [bacterium]|jgi:putative flippase GtrA|nr:GtrA family protein [bacterium]
MNYPSSIQQSAFLKTFTRHQAASFAATLMDYLCLFFMTEALQIHYALATATGALVGACSNFLLNRHWAFEARSGNWTTQSFRYFLVSSGSLILNTGGVYYFTESYHLHYATSVVIISILVGICFNFPLHKNFVYSVKTSARPSLN